MEVLTHSTTMFSILKQQNTIEFVPNLWNLVLDFKSIILFLKLLTCNILLLMLKAKWRINWQLSTGQFWTVKISTMIYVYYIPFNFQFISTFTNTSEIQNIAKIDSHLIAATGSGICCQPLIFSSNANMVLLLDKALKVFLNYSFFLQRKSKLSKV